MTRVFYRRIAVWNDELDNLPVCLLQSDHLLRSRHLLDGIVGGRDAALARVVNLDIDAVWVDAHFLAVAVENGGDSLQLVALLALRNDSQLLPVQN